MLNLAKAIMYVSVFSGIAPLLLMLVYKERLKHRYFILIGLLITFSFIIDLISLIAIKSHSILSNTYLGNFHTIIQFTLLLLIYREFYLKERSLLILSLCAIYLGFEMINSLFFQSPNINQTWSWAFSAVILMGLSVGYFKHLLNSNPLFDITKFGPFWVNVAVLLYFGFSLYLFVMAEYVFTKMEANTAIIFWGFHNVNNILKNLIFAIGIYRSVES